MAITLLRLDPLLFRTTEERKCFATAVAINNHLQTRSNQVVFNEKHFLTLRGGYLQINHIWTGWSPWGYFVLFFSLSEFCCI